MLCIFVQMQKVSSTKKGENQERGHAHACCKYGKNEERSKWVLSILGFKECNAEMFLALALSLTVASRPLFGVVPFRSFSLGHVPFRD